MSSTGGDKPRRGTGGAPSCLLCYRAVMEEVEGESAKEVVAMKLVDIPTCINNDPPCFSDSG